MNWLLPPLKKKERGGGAAAISKGSGGKVETVVQGGDEMHSIVTLVEQHLHLKAPLGQKQESRVMRGNGR